MAYSGKENAIPSRKYREEFLLEVAGKSALLARSRSDFAIISTSRDRGGPLLLLLIENARTATLGEGV
jgi:hypothetical protein